MITNNYPKPDVFECKTNVISSTELTGTVACDTPEFDINNSTDPYEKQKFPV